MKQKFYSFLLLIMAMLCMGANNVMAYNSLTIRKNTLGTIAAEENGIYTFCPTETANYLFDFDPGMITQYVFYVSVYDEEPTDSSNPLNRNSFLGTTFVLELEGNKTYYVEVSNALDEDLTTATLDISKYEPNYTAIQKGENTVSLAAAGMTILKFKAPENKHYAFSLPDNLNISGRSSMMIFSGDPMINSESMVASGLKAAIAKDCTANNDYYVMVINNSGNAYEDITLTISEYETNYPSIAMGNNEVTVPGNYGSTYAFTSTTAGDYLFSVNVDWTVEHGMILITNVDPVFMNQMSIGMVAAGGSSLLATLEANKTYYVSVSNGTNTDVTSLTVSKAYHREMTNEWGTLCLPYAIDYDADNKYFNLYKLTQAEPFAGTLTFTECETGTIPAGTPLAIKALKDAYYRNVYTVNVSYSGEAVTEVDPYIVGDFRFNGTFSELTNKLNIWYIAEGKFWYANPAITIPANRAWIEQVHDEGEDDLAPARTFDIIEGGETTGIQLTDNEDGTVTMSFDLQGHRAESQKGLQIRNGRVVLVK